MIALKVSSVIPFVSLSYLEIFKLFFGINPVVPWMSHANAEERERVAARALIKIPFFIKSSVTKNQDRSIMAARN
jgi:hypothetical protein